MTSKKWKSGRAMDREGKESMMQGYGRKKKVEDSIDGKMQARNNLT